MDRRARTALERRAASAAIWRTSFPLTIVAALVAVSGLEWRQNRE